MNLRLRSLRIVALVVVVSLPLLGMSGVASAKAPVVGSPKWCAAHKHKALSTPGCPTYTGGGGGSTTGGGDPPNITVQIDPGSVETFASGITDTIQVETSPSFAGDPVLISSSQLQSSCNYVQYFTIQSTAGDDPIFYSNDITVYLDDDGNATVLVAGLICAPGNSVVEADLEDAPYYTALGTLVASPPNTTPAGITGSPTTSGTVTTGEVETGDTPTSGESDVYAVFYVETDPVYAEQEVEISSGQLEAACGTGWTWANFDQNGISIVGTGVNTGPPSTAYFDDDGNAVFVFFGSSCAAATYQVLATVLAGSHPGYSTPFTVDAPQPTIAT